MSVKIKNQGDLAYRHDDFGDSIIVERHFNRSGASQFKIKSVEERTISTKRADLEDMLDYLALQLDNPMNVLSQDMARQFLASSSPNDKYKFFIRGTQLEQLDKDYRIMEDFVNNAEAKLQDRKDDITILKKEVQEADAKKKMIEKTNTIRQRIYRLRWMHAWAQVEEVEGELAAREDELRKAEENIEQITRDSEGAGEAYERHNNAHASAQKTREELETELGPHKDSHAEIKDQFDKYKNDLIESATMRRNINEDIKTSRSTIAKAKAEMTKEQARIDAANGPARAQKLADLEDAKNEHEAAQACFRDVGDKTVLERDKDDAKAAADNVRESLEPRREAVRQAEGVLHGLQSDQDQHMAGYDGNVHTLLRAIRNESRFRDKPVGPMGMHVSLVKPEWSSILEKTFGGVLESFVVTNKQDQSLLGELQRRHKYK